MSKKMFTEKEIEILKKNKYAKRVSSKGITYTDEMKQFAFAKVRKEYCHLRYLRKQDLTYQ